MTRQITDPALALIKQDEGLELDAYYDAVGVLTIGYGHTGPDVTEDMLITEDQATELLRADLLRFEDAVDRFTAGCPTTDNQFSAMVSLTYNIGEGAFKGSSVLRFHRAGEFDHAADAFLLWNKGHVD